MWTVLYEHAAKIEPVTAVPRSVTQAERGMIGDFASEGLVNINTASQTELEALPKIGEEKAAAIIDYRQANGEFRTVEDIKRVKGTGDAIFEAIKTYICV